MPLMHMNWKTGRMEPCIDPELKRGQLVVGFDGPASQHDGVVLARQESARWGTSYQILWMDDLRTSGHQVIRPIAERFGIGVYFHPGKFMPEAEIVKLEQRFHEKEKIEAEEAEKRRVENERFSAIGRERFEAAIRKLSHAPATWEHRENYTGGHGFYLAESKYCGWAIEKIPLYNDEQLERFFCNAGKTGGFCVK